MTKIERLQELRKGLAELQAWQREYEDYPELLEVIDLDALEELEGVFN